MSYSCTDAYSDITGALKLKTPDSWDEDGVEHVSEETDLALAEIVRLQKAEAACKAFLAWVDSGKRGMPSEKKLDAAVRKARLALKKK